MRGKLGKGVSRGRRVARRALKKVETRLLAIEGRRSLRSKARKAGRIGRDVLVAGTLLAAVAALEAALHDLRRRHLTA